MIVQIFYLFYSWLLKLEPFAYTVAKTRTILSFPCLKISLTFTYGKCDYAPASWDHFLLKSLQMYDGPEKDA